LKIDVDEKKRMELESKILPYRSPELSGIHVSHLVFCLRKSYFRKINPKADTSEKTYHFLRGRSHHLFLEVLPLHEIEVSRDPTAIVDMTEDGAIYEIKSTLSDVRSPQPHWIEQLMYYVVLSKSLKREHYLVIFHITKPSLTVYRVSITENDVQKYTEKLWAKYNLLKKAIEQKRPDILSRTEFKWYCKKCEYEKECNEVIDKNWNEES
jgi:CRISPR/Cas system-associated exonuclease Cas4 (RecB family)